MPPNAANLRQAIDLAAEHITLDAPGIRRLQALKTGGLFVFSARAGAILARADEAAMIAFGRDLGTAFQITDDMLDYEGTESVTGKPAGLDLRGRKVTLPLVGALREMTAAEVDRVRHLFTLVEPGDEEIEDVIELVRRNGGLQYARHKAMGYANAANAATRGLTPGPALDALREAVLHVMDRSR